MRFNYILFIIWNRLCNRYIYTPINKIKLIYCGVNFYKNIIFKGNIWLINNGNFSIGDKVRVISGFQNSVGAFKKTSFWIGRNASLLIGNNVGISNTTFVCLLKITIGDNVFIGGGCDIYDTDFHSLNAKERISFKGLIPTGEILIEKNVFIGGHCKILKNVKIGEGAIIGAGSIVTTNIPAYEVWAGVPAKFIKKIDHEQ